MTCAFNPPCRLDALGGFEEQIQTERDGHTHGFQHQPAGLCPRKMGLKRCHGFAVASPIAFPFPVRAKLALGSSNVPEAFSRLVAAEFILELAVGIPVPFRHAQGVVEKQADVRHSCRPEQRC